MQNQLSNLNTTNITGRPFSLMFAEPYSAGDYNQISFVFSEVENGLANAEGEKEEGSERLQTDTTFGTF